MLLGVSRRVVRNNTFLKESRPTLLSLPHKFGPLLIMVKPIKDLVLYDPLDCLHELLVFFRGVGVQFAQVAEVEILSVKRIIEVVTDAAPSFINRQL